MKIHYIILFVVSLLTIEINSNAQPKRYIGKVISKETNEPIPFAYVKIKNVALGTVTQADGHFQLLVPQAHQNSGLEFSYVGYKSVVLPLKNIPDIKNILVVLEEDTKLLREVVITPRKNESPKAIVRKALANVKQNYPQQDFSLTGYYRETIQENGAYIMYADAAVEYALKPYLKSNYKWKEYAPNWVNLNKTMSSFSWNGGTRLHRYHFHSRTLKDEKVNIVDSRASSNLTTTQLNASIEGGPLNLIGKDRLKFLKYFLEKMGKYKYTLDGQIDNPDGTWSYVISFIPAMPVEKYKKKKRPYNNAFKHGGKLYIDDETYAITKIETYVPTEYKEFICGFESWNIRHFAYAVTSEYKKIGNKYFLDQVRQEDEFIIHDTVQNIITPYSAISSLKVHNIYPDSVITITPEQDFPNTDANRLFDYPLEFNSQFWEAYEASHPEARIEPAIRQDMESNRTLEQQFAGKNIRDTSLLSPVAKKITRENKIHGVKWTDDYAWLKDTKNPRANADIMNYLQQENEYTDNYFAPLRKDQRNFYAEFMTSVDRDFTSLPYKRNNYYYYYRYRGEQEYPTYYRRHVEDSLEQAILDVNEMAKDKDYYSINGYVVSPDEDLIAYFENTNGTDEDVVKFKSLKTNKVLTDSLERVGSLVWINNDELFYTKVEQKTYRQSEVYYHKMGYPQLQDKLVFKEKDKQYSLSIDKSKSKEFVFLRISSSTTSETYIHRIGTGTKKFKLFKPREEGHLYGIKHYKEHFYMATNKNAPNFKIVKLDTSSINGKQKVVVPHSKDVYINDFELFTDYLVVNERVEAVDKLRVIEWETGQDHYINFKEKIYTSRLSYNPDFDVDSIRLYYQSYKTVPTYYAYHPPSKKKKVLKKTITVNNLASKAIIVERVWVTARDGKSIPMDLIYNKYWRGGKKNKMKVFISSYGAYGSAQTASHNNTIHALLSKGFMYAVPHVRGGADLGMKWYEDGKMMNKKNTFYDFIDCTEYLINEGITTKDLIVAQGGSAGGLLMGAIANMRPDLYKIIILDVPFVDVVNTMLDPDLPLTTLEYQEWGSPLVKKQFDYIRSYSPYDNIKQQPYPHMLFFTGLNDTRVGYWEPAKMVAKLRNMKTNDNLVLLKTDFSSGHGGASGRFEYYRDTAYKYALIFDLLEESVKAQAESN